MSTVSTLPLRYPNNFNTPLDSICKRVIERLEKNKIPGATVVFNKTETFTYVEKIVGRNFTILCGLCNNQPTATSIDVQDKPRDICRWFEENILMKKKAATKEIVHEPGLKIKMPANFSFDPKQFLEVIKMYTSEYPYETMGKLDLIIDGNKISFKPEYVQVKIHDSELRSSTASWPAWKKDFIEATFWEITVEIYKGGLNHSRYEDWKKARNPEPWEKYENRHSYKADEITLRIRPEPFETIHHHGENYYDKCVVLELSNYNLMYD